MRILALIGDRPIPAVTGINVRNYHLWTQVARRSDITLKVLGLDIAPARFTEPPEFPGVDTEFFRVEPSGPVKKAWGLFSKSWHEFPQSRALTERVDELAKSWNPDVIHAEELRMSAYLPGIRGKATKARQSVTFHNVESDLFARLVSPGVPFAKGLAAKMQVASLKRFEKTVVKAADLPLAYSEADRDRYHSIIPSPRWQATRNGTDVQGIQPRPMPATPSVLILARWTYAPNRDGLAWFVQQVRPLLAPGLRIVVAGSGADAEIRNLIAGAGFTFIDTPLDLEPVYAEASAVVVPVLQGSGTRGKILEALAYQRPIVTTTKGVEGLALGADEGVLIGDDPESFAARLTEVLAEPAEKRWEAAGRGRAAVLAKYDWSVVAAELVEAWRSCASR